MQSPERTGKIPAAVKLYYSRREAAASLAICIRSIDALIKTGQLRSIKLGGRVLIPSDALTNFVPRPGPIMRRGPYRTVSASALAVSAMSR